MNTLSINDTAGNGTSVQTTVCLLWDDDEPFAELPFYARTMVGGTYLAHSHHKTNSDAKRHAEKMHAAYLEVHRS